MAVLEWDQLRWIVLLFLAVLAGVLFVQYLTVPPRTMALFAVLLTLDGLGLVILLGTSFHGGRLLLGIGVLLVAFVAGYLIDTFRILNWEEQRTLPQLNIPPQAVSDNGMANSGHTAVIYFTHGEPPGYSVMPWVETFREFDADHAPFIPAPFRPFFFYGLRGKYLTTGGSPHNFIHQTMLAGLEDLVRAEGDTTTRFYLAFLDSNPRPDEMVIRAVNEGATKIVLAPIFLTISSHTQAGSDMVADLKLPEKGIPVCQAAPLWDSPDLKQMFVVRANHALQEASSSVDKSKVGILLVGHGQPDEWDKIYVSQTAQENEFRQSVMDLFVMDGFKRENISLAWMEFKQPEPAERAQELAAQGVEKILIFSAAISAPSIHSEYDVPDAVRTAKLPKSVQVINLGAWGYDPLVLKAIREKLKVCGI